MTATLLHSTGDLVSYDQLRDIPTPESTRTYTPIRHVELLDAVRREIESGGLIIAAQSLALSQSRSGRYGDRFFGLLEIGADTDADFRTAVGIRNSHDRVFPAGLCVGSRVLVCDNLAFSAEVVIARKHTSRIRRDLPRLINEAVGRLGDLRERQGHRIDAYRRAAITDPQFHDLAIRAVDSGVVAASKLPAVLQAFRESEHEEFRPRTVWSGFNAFTEVLKDYDVQDLPRRTQRLHGLCDVLSHVS